MRGIIIVCCIALVSCAGTQWKNTATITYEETGAQLANLQQTLKTACDAGRISPARCDEAKRHYNEARAEYILAGDDLKAALRADTSTAQGKQAAFDTAMLTVSRILRTLTLILIEEGVR